MNEASAPKMVRPKKVEAAMKRWVGTEMGFSGEFVGDGTE